MLKHHSSLKHIATPKFQEDYFFFLIYIETAGMTQQLVCSSEGGHVRWKEQFLHLKSRSPRKQKKASKSPLLHHIV